ncbi:hypothetical protein B0P06_006109 [Clostridium saccharoperbutylacetonicum]|nr:hypothetical protein [Clostridium saccharoperbutylacetonicum]NSB46216.1 hypothetical protein [Clostridium saccharoperbutylacetonicum]
MEQYKLEKGYFFIFDFRKTERLFGELRITNIEIEVNSKKY